MNISALFKDSKVFAKNENLHLIAFRNALTRQDSVLLPVLCAGFSEIREICAHFYRFECLLPQISLH